MGKATSFIGLRAACVAIIWQEIWARVKILIALLILLLLLLSSIEALTLWVLHFASSFTSIIFYFIAVLLKMT